jgi:adenylate cyclase
MTHSALHVQLNKASEAFDSSSFDEAEHLAHQVLAELDASTVQVKQPTSDVEKLRAGAYLILGRVARKRGNYSTSLSHFIAAQAVGEAINDHEEMGKISNDIGHVYWNLSEFPAALENFQKSLAIYEKLGSAEGIARNLGNIGGMYWNLSDYAQALEYYQKTLHIYETLGETDSIAKVLGNMGAVYSSMADYARALEYLQRALTMYEQLNSKHGVAINLGNIGLVYSSLSDYTHALEYYQKSLAMYEELGDTKGIASMFGNIGNIHHNRSDYTQAFEYIHKSLALHEKLDKKDGILGNLGNIGMLHYKLLDYSKALEYLKKALAIAEEIGSKDSMTLCIGNIGGIYASKEFDGYDPTIAEEFMMKAIAMNGETGAIGKNIDVFQNLANLYEGMERWKEANEYNKKYYELEKQVESDEAKKQASILEQQRQAAEREKHLELERMRTTAEKRILNNILPEEITNRLIQGENPIADHFDSVSVLFMDIVDFTPLASSITAQQLVHLLNAIFSAADSVMREFGMEKIKTIGDAYMAVAGAPVLQHDHAQRAGQAALKLLDVMENLVVTFPENYGDRSWIQSIPEIQVRIGLHCGSAAAGVVGENKFLYDLWGDAVNTASRMESHGEAGKIHVSEEFLKRLLMERNQWLMDNGEWLIEEANDFSSFAINHSPSTINNLPLTIIPRGEMEIKGKGMMKTYFLEKTHL